MSHPPVECRVGFLATNINSWVPQPTLSSQLEDLATNILTRILNIGDLCGNKYDHHDYYIVNDEKEADIEYCLGGSAA